MLVRDRMISPRERIKEDTPIKSVVEAFEMSSSPWLPVTDQEGHLLGTITPSRIQKAKKILAGHPSLKY